MITPPATLPLAFEARVAALRGATCCRSPVRRPFEDLCVGDLDIACFLRELLGVHAPYNWIEYRWHLGAGEMRLTDDPQLCCDPTLDGGRCVFIVVVMRPDRPVVIHRRDRTLVIRQRAIYVTPSYDAYHTTLTGGPACVCECRLYAVKTANDRAS